MIKRISEFFRPMWRTIWMALAGIGFFALSAITMSPLRMWENPVVNYNLFYVPIVAVLFGWLFYRCCTEAVEARGYVYGFFAALVAWPLIAEVPSIPLDEGIITQFTDFEMKVLGAYFHLIVCWALLHVMWRTGALKKSVGVFFMTFFAIWTFELYMDNYSSMDAGKFDIVGSLIAVAIFCMLLACVKYALGRFKAKKPFQAILGILVICVLAGMTVFNFIDAFVHTDPLKKMAPMGNLVLYFSLTAAFIILRAARRAESLERKTILGAVFYIVFALIFMSGQWKEPQTFYVKYEAAHIDHEIEALKQDKETLARLFGYMANKRMLKAPDYKYMFERGIITREQLMELVNFGRIDGKGLEFLATRGIITVDEFQAVLDRKMLSDKDMQALVDMGIARKNDEGVYELQRQYIKIKEK
jgi:hypothetical protein